MKEKLALIARKKLFLCFLCLFVTMICSDVVAVCCGSHGESVVCVLRRVAERASFNRMNPSAMLDAARTT